MLGLVSEPSSFFFMSGSMGELIRLRLIGFSIRSWVLPVVHGHRPERVYRGQFTGREGQRIVVLAAIQRLAFRVRAGHGIDGFSGIVTVDTTMAAAERFSQSP